MSIRPTQQLDSYATLPSVSDKEIRTKEAKSIYYRILIFIIIDLILSIIIILHEWGVFSDKDTNYLILIIESSIVTIFFILISILLSCLRPLLSISVKYIYIILGFFYYIYNIIFHIIYFVNNSEDIYWLDFLFMFLVLINVTPRIFFWYYINLFIPKVKLIVDCKDGEDHDKLLQKVGNKMDRGDTEWSRAGNSERPTNQFLTMSVKKISQDNKFKYSIKENYIKEEDLKNEEDNNKEENNEENEDKNE